MEIYIRLVGKMVQSTLDSLAYIDIFIYILGRTTLLVSWTKPVMNVSCVIHLFDLFRYIYIDIRVPLRVSDIEKSLQDLIILS